jgi:hypothetical protein
MTRKITLSLAKILFIITLVILGSVFVLPGKTEAATSTTVYAHLNLTFKDPQGLIVKGINYAVYEQQKDADNNPILGKKLASGSVYDVGYKSVSLRNSANTTLNLAIVYYQTNSEFGKFYLYNQTVTGAEIKSIRLPFSGAKISVADPAGAVIANYKFDLYAVLKASNGSVMGYRKVLSYQNTGDSGYKYVYLKTGEYFITIKNLSVADPEINTSSFNISENNITDFKYSLGAVRLSFHDETAQSQKVSFKILKKRNGSYFSVGSFTTDEYGNKRVALPAGEYRLDAKMVNSQYAGGFEFSVLSGYEKSYSFNQSNFTFRVIDGYRNPMSNLKISIYKYNDSKHVKVFSGTTNINGEVKPSLVRGTYIADIDTLISGQKYQNNIFFVQNYNGYSYEYVVSMTRIYLQNNAGANLANQKFYIYNFATDANSKTITGKEIGSYTTNNLGYYDINLVPGRYIVKPVAGTKIFPILIETGKFNTFYLTAVIDPTYVQPTPPVVAQPTKTVTTPDTNTVYMASIFTNVNLYNKDTDKDTLADFEETYIWHTNPNKADTDGDGYLDNDEIPNGYNPLGPGKKAYVIWAYEKPRVSDLRIEQREAMYLKAEITRRLGRVPQVSDTNWNTLIKAFVYGGYTVSEIQNTVQYGPGLVHPVIPAYKWRVMRSK